MTEIPGLPRADHVLVDLDAIPKAKAKLPADQVLDIEVVSDKSRDPRAYKTDAEFQNQITDDAKEAVSKYGGEVDLRTSKIGGVLYEGRARVTDIYLLYDSADLTELDKTTIRNAVRDSNKPVKVIFSDELGIPAQTR